MNHAGTIIVFDVETTGIDPRQGHEIVEIGAERVTNGEVVGEFEELIKPTRPIEPDAQAVSGITQDLVDVSGRPAEEVIPEFLQFIGNDVLVGHNVKFDTDFINAHLERMGEPPITNRYVDTLSMAKSMLIIPRYSLERVARYLKIPQPVAHRALADVQTTRKVFLTLLDRQSTKA